LEDFRLFCKNCRVKFNSFFPFSYWIYDQNDNTLIQFFLGGKGSNLNEEKVFTRNIKCS